MIPWPLLAEILLCGVTIGGAIVLVTVLARLPAAARLGGPLALLALAVAAYAAELAPGLGARLQAIALLQVAAAALICSAVGLLWLCIRIVFEDSVITWRSWVPAAGLAAIGVGALSVQGPPRQALLIAYYAGCIALGLKGVGLVLGGWRNDLVAARRRLRLPLAGLAVLCSTYVLADTLAGAATRAGLVQSWFTLWREAALAALVVMAAAILAARLHRRADPSRTGKAAWDDGRLIRNLEAAMVEREVWRREGLTIRDLAREMGAPEYRLRRAIHEGLGHRNFPSFVNAYRIQAAQQRLTSSPPPQTTVATVAFETGFSSLSAFNRAFKEAVGQTPTEWRRGAAVSAAPQSLSV